MVADDDMNDTSESDNNASGKDTFGKPCVQEGSVGDDEEGVST